MGFRNYVRNFWVAILRPLRPVDGTKPAAGSQQTAGSSQQPAAASSQQPTKMQLFYIFYIGSFPVYKGAKNLGKSTQKVDKGDIVEGSLEVKLPTGPFNNLS